MGLPVDTTMVARKILEFGIGQAHHAVETEHLEASGAPRVPLAVADSLSSKIDLFIGVDRD